MTGGKFGQYRVLERLGTGAMGSVYRAADDMLGRDVALKILDTTMDGATARFRAEAAALARLNHPGIATIHELVEDDGRLVMAMEYVRGQSLQEILEQVGVFSPRRAAELCMQALAALAHAHASGVVHRDLKPGNLMLTEGGAIKIMDFGIARFDGAVNLTHAGTTLGTPAYMAPEQVLGHPIDARADLYALGIVFFRLVTAALPFNADTPFDMAQAQVNDPPAKASEVRPELPEWVDDILARVLAKKPGDRFQSAMEFHEAFALAIALPYESSPAGVAGATEKMPRPDFAVSTAGSSTAAGARATTARRPRTLWWTAGAAAALAAAWWLFTPGRPASPNGPVTATSSLAESAPPPSSEPGAVAVTPAAFTPDLTAGRATKTLKPPAVADTPALPPVSFSNVKLLSVDGARTSASDVVLQLSGADVTVQPVNSTTASATLPYQHLARVTYAHGRDPKWDAALSGPLEKIDLPGILGRARHWLVLQAADGYLILRLDGDDWRGVMTALEERARIVIDRSSTVKNP